MATRAQIRERARIRADQDASTFPTDAQYNLLIDEAVKDVWYDLVQAGWPISFKSATLPCSANPMPVYAYVMANGGDDSDPVAFIHGVYCVEGGTTYALKRVNEGERAMLNSHTGATRPTHYEVRVDMVDGLVVEVFPNVTGAQLRVDYVLEHPGFTDDSTSWRGPARSDELIVLRAAAKGCRKEGNDQGAAQLDKEYLFLLEKVQGMASWIDMRNPPTIADVSRHGVPRDLSDYDVDLIL